MIIENKKIILAEGDSWTAGDIIDPALEDSINGYVNHSDNDHYRLPKVWPGKLSELSGIPVINNAHAGSSNDGIVRRTVSSILSLLEEYNPEEILVIIGFSSPERKDFYFSKGESHGWDTLYPLDKFEDNPDRSRFKKSYVDIYWNKPEYISRYIHTVLYLYSFLKLRKIDCLFFDAFYEVEETPIFNTYISLHKAIQKFYLNSNKSILKNQNLLNLFTEYNNIYENHFIPVSIKEYLISFKKKLFDNIHPSEEGHQKWAKFIFNYLKNINLKSLKDKVNTATFWDLSDDILKLYEHVPEIKELDERGYEMIRPVFSHSNIDNTLNVEEISVDQYNFEKKDPFIYCVSCHHNLSLIGKHIEILPGYVLDGIRNKSCKLILDDSLEGRHISFILKNLYKAVERLKLIPSQIYYITNNLFAEQQHLQYLDKHKIKHGVNVISYMYNVHDIKRLIYSQDVVKGGRLPEKVDISKLIKYKKNNIEDIKPFLKVNRTGRPERNLFMLFVNKFNLYNKFKISFPNYGEEGDYDKFPQLTSKSNIDSLKEKIPFDIDRTDQDNHGPPGVGKGRFNADLPFQVKHYNDTFISIVFCAFPFDDACHLHSSTFNPIYCGHPIIQFGPKGSLAELRRRGFKTFSTWWDESYDDIEDGWDRLRAIFNLVEKLSKRTNKELLEMYSGMKHVLQHNSNLISSYNIYTNLTNRVINENSNAVS